MKLLVITHTPHWQQQQKLWAYDPYVREMNLWFNHVDQVRVIAPLAKEEKTAIHSSYKKQEITLRKVPGISVVSLRESIYALIKLPFIIFVVYSEMRKADHIHLRCPGNMGLIGAVVQILFPKKKKTVKYAGNWDPKSNQPWSYRLQKRIIKNTSLSKNTKVLVYGEWRNQSKNIHSFFTASFSEIKREHYLKTLDKTIRFMFVGSLVSGKRPEYTIALVEKLVAQGFDAHLDIYGDGALRKILDTGMRPFIHFHGNTSSDEVYTAYKCSHFLILPSKSEGWPKVVAEAMFCGLAPIATPISCVPWMLDGGNRGLFLSMNLEEDLLKIGQCINDKEHYLAVSKKAQKWSQQYTLESFEQEIKKLLR